MQALLIKYAVMGLLLAGVALSLIMYGKHLTQQKWDAAMAKQAIKSAETTIAQAENTAKVEIRYIKVKGDTEIITNTVEKEVIRYVKEPIEKCQLTPEFERAFDTVSRVYDPSAERLSAPANPSGDVDADAAPRLTDAAVLRAYAHVVVQLKELWDTYSALVEWIRTNHEVQLHGVGRHLLEETP